MKVVPLLTLIVMAGLVIAADMEDDLTKKHLEKLKGSWTVESAEKDGKPVPEAKGGKLEFAGNKFTRKTGNEIQRGTFKLDVKAKPKAIDFHVTEGPDKDKTVQAIYGFQADNVRLCVAQIGQSRPTEFASKAGKGQVLVILKRDAVVAQAPAKNKDKEKPKDKPADKPMPPAPPAFADKNLEAAVRAVLHEPKAELNDGNLVNVYVLEAPNKGIANLKGLEKCKNLALLKLTGNQVVDLTPLKDLKNIQSLDLAGNKITDIAPLAGLTKLQYLELSNNQVANVAPLKGLSSLSALYLSGNKIADIAPLSGLTKLSSLSLSKNQVKDIAPLGSVTRLTVLDLNDNQIQDLSPLLKQTELSLLMVERNRITDLSPLVKMAKADAEGAKRFAPYLRVYLKGNPSPLDTLKGYGVRVDY